jgi:hypothetical protein
MFPCRRLYFQMGVVALTFLGTNWIFGLKYVERLFIHLEEDILTDFLCSDGSVAGATRCSSFLTLSVRCSSSREAGTVRSSLIFATSFPLLTLSSFSQTARRCNPMSGPLRVSGSSSASAAGECTSLTSLTLVFSFVSPRTRVVFRSSTAPSSSTSPSRANGKLGSTSTSLSVRRRPSLLPLSEN